MVTLVKQEMYKLYKKKSTLILFGVIVLLMIVFAIFADQQSDIVNPETMFTTAYNAYSWLVFILIVQAAAIITMEFEYGTIKNLLFRNYSRTEVLISKWIALFIHTLVLYVSTTLIAMILKMFVHPDMSFTQDVTGDMNLIQSLLGTGAGTILNVWLILSLVLLLSTIFRNTAVSVVSGIIFYFAASIVSGILFSAIEKWEWVKWNPLNMINLSNQILDSSLSSFTQLSVLQLVIASFVYIAIFLFLVFLVFRKKNV